MWREREGYGRHMRLRKHGLLPPLHTIRGRLHQHTMTCLAPNTPRRFLPACCAFTCIPLPCALVAAGAYTAMVQAAVAGTATPEGVAAAAAAYYACSLAAHMAQVTYACHHRGRMRAKEGLPRAPCADWWLWCCCGACAVCQEGAQMEVSALLGSPVAHAALHQDSPRGCCCKQRALPAEHISDHPATPHPRRAGPTAGALPRGGPGSPGRAAAAAHGARRVARCSLSSSRQQLSSKSDTAFPGTLSLSGRKQLHLMTERQQTEARLSYTRQSVSSSSLHDSNSRHQRRPASPLFSRGERPRRTMAPVITHWPSSRATP